MDRMNRPCPSWSLLTVLNRSLWLLTLGLVLAMPAPSANAFSLLCRTCDDCPDAPYSVLPGDIGPPANLGEEYRWNVPVVVYTFDASFLDYFGSAGVAAVESAIGILNSLPPASQINPSNHPPEVTQINHQAQGLGLLDLKSMALALLLEQLGLAQPTRHVFDLHEWSADNPLVVIRNFDPFTTAPSHSVNDTLYDWLLVTSGPLDPEPDFAEAVEFPVDPLSPVFTAVADRALTPGMFYTGLTRDDAGGLRYLLRTNNLNLEILLPGVYGIGTNADAYVTTALRPGVDKITFVRRDYDGLLGQFFAPFTNQFTDRFVMNNEVKHQWVERVITAPDILFTASAPAAGDRHGLVFSRTGTSNWWNSATGTGLPGVTGPGVIRPQLRIAFHKFTPTVFATDDSAAGTAQLSAYGWGSFDGSANPPVVYPLGTVPDGDQLTVRLRLHPATDDAATVEHFWQLPVAFGSGAALEMSSDLNSWTRLTTVTNLGQPIEWDHVRSQARKFYRVVPQ